MSKLTIKDLSDYRDLNEADMTTVVGGLYGPAISAGIAAGVWAIKQATSYPLITEEVKDAGKV